MSYGQNLVRGEGTSLSRVGPYLSILFWSCLILSDAHMKFYGGFITNINIKLSFICCPRTCFSRCTKSLGHSSKRRHLGSPSLEKKRGVKMKIEHAWDDTCHIYTYTQLEIVPLMEQILHQLIVYLVYRTIHNVLYIPRGAGISSINSTWYV